MTKPKWPKRLSAFGWTYLAIALGICFFVLICPYSEPAIRIYKFQTLITGMAAGVAALVSAWIVYRAAIEQVEEQRSRDKRQRCERERAGAAILYAKINEIIEATASNLNKNMTVKAGIVAKLDIINIDSLLKLELIGTQPPDVAFSVSQLIARADMFNKMLSDHFRDQTLPRPDPTKILEFINEGIEVRDRLETIAVPDKTSRAFPKKSESNVALLNLC